MARNDPELRVRIPEGLRDRIVAKAAERGVSLSAQVVELLSQAMEWEKYDIPAMDEAITDLQERMSRVEDRVLPPYDND